MAAEKRLDPLFTCGVTPLHGTAGPADLACVPKCHTDILFHVAVKLRMRRTMAAAKHDAYASSCAHFVFVR